MNPRILGVIPARFGSTRFPGKPLHLIAGKPMIEWVILGAKKSRRLDEVIVATDHEGIEKVALALGVRAIMTPSDLPSGSDRIWHAVKNEVCDVIINIQGDEPLVSAQMIDDLCEVFLRKSNPQAQGQSQIDMATVGKAITEEELRNNNVVKVVCNCKGEALYFSRYPIPFSRGPFSPGGCLKHIGMYGYRKEFLEKFCNTPPALIELSESLEQLRALYLGASIQVVTTSLESIGVDTPEDVAKIETTLAKTSGVAEASFKIGT